MIKTVLNYQTTNIRFPNGRGTNYHHDAYNCKLTFINPIGHLLGISPTKADKEAFDQVLKECRIAVAINTATTAIKDWILENYEIYSCSKIPIGYQHGYQYHIIIRNTIGVPNPNMRPTEFIKEDDKPLSPRKTEAKLKILKLLKDNKRKTDLVDKILELV